MKLIKKFMTKEVILYVVFGILTTIINLFAFYLLNSIFKLNENISNLIAIILAVLVAYLTNKDLVFHSQANTVKQKIIEFLKFILGRVFTMLVEFIGGIILFNLPIPNIIVKLFLTVIVIILNFFISKFFAFNHKKNNIGEN